MKKYVQWIVVFLFIGFILQSVSNVDAATEEKKSVPKLFYMTRNTATAQVDNSTIKISETYDQNVIPYIESEILYVPAKYVAKFMNGTDSYTKKTKKTTIKLAGSTFIVKANSKIVTINGKNITMKNKALEKGGNLMIPASIFVDNLKTHNAIVYEERALIISKKGATDFYTDNNEPIGYCVPDDTTWQETLKKQAKGEKAKKAAQEILAKIITPDMTDLEKVIAVNDYLIQNTTYTSGDYSIYGPILDGTGVCQGYAFSAELLLNMAGVNCTRIQGYAGIGSKELTNDILDALGYMGNLHEWNLVEIDGNWYHLDITFSDGTVNGEESFQNAYQYFLLSDTEISDDHIWRKTFYKEAPKSFTSTTLANTLDSKGYPVIHGRISLPNGEVAPKGGVEVSVRVGMGLNLNIDRAYLIKEGKSYVDFTIVASKTIDKQRFQNSFRIITNTRGYEKEVYLLDTSATNVQGVLVKKDINLINGKLIIPSSVTLTKDYKYTVELTTYYKVEGANGLRNDGGESFDGILKAGEKEATFDFDCTIPSTEYEYTIRYYISGFNKTPLVESGFLTANGAIASERTYIKGSEKPLTDFIIQVNAKEVTPTPTPTEAPKLSGTKMTKENRAELVKTLKNYNIGNNAKLSKLKTEKQIIAFETSEPYQVSNAMNGDYTMYYKRNLDSGIKLSTIYSFQENNKKLYISTTISNIELSKEYYMTTMNELNQYLQTATSSKKIADFYVVSYENYGVTVFDAKNKEQIFQDIMAHKVFIEANYTVGDSVYQISLMGEENELPRVTISRFTKKVHSEY
jgi:hypothetical protein|nr:stalk domain-containing protein [uncultured Lachnoclostridium sp.]